MGIFDTFRKPVIGIKEAGIGLVSRGSYWGKVDEDPQNLSLQQKYDNAYNNFPIVAAAIDTTAEQTVQDFYFEGPHSKELTDWAEVVNLPQKFDIIAKHMLKNGNIWSEHPNNNVMKLINPKTMKTWRTRTDDIVGHSQEIDSTNKILWGSTGDKTKDQTFTKHAPIKNIVHFKFNAHAGEKYGSSIIHSVLPLLEIKSQIEGDLKIIVRRYSAPIIHAQVGDEMHLPSDDDLTSIKAGLKDIYADTEYVTNYLTKFDVLGFEGKALNVDYILKHVDNNILVGLRVFKEVIGMEGGGKESAEVKLRAYGRHVKALQRAIKTEFEDKIIIGLELGNQKDHLVWGDAEEREQEIEIDQIRGLVTDGIITPQKANSLLPPEFQEELPPELANPAKQAFTSQQQNQRPFQKGDDKIHDKPTDPTLKQKEPNERRVKTDREIPVK